MARSNFPRAILEEMHQRLSRCFYALEGREVVKSNMTQWASMMEETNSERFLSRDTIRPQVEVSTVFLGLDHSLGRADVPILFETMVFGGKCAGQAQRYTDFDDAIQGHQHVVRELMKIERVPRRWRSRIETRMFRREFNRVTKEMEWIPTELEI